MTSADADMAVEEDEARMRDAQERKAGSILKRPSGSSVSRKAAITLSGASKPAAPEQQGDMPVHLWRGGKIYTLMDKKVFRVKKKVDDRVDHKFSFKHVPFAEAWKKCIDFIAS